MLAESASDSADLRRTDSRVAPVADAKECHENCPENEIATEGYIQYDQMNEDLKGPCRNPYLRGLANYTEQIKATTRKLCKAL